MNNNPIGILDSGVGGLTVWNSIVHYLPKESTIYAADSLNTPYGDKSPKEIFDLSRRMISVLLQWNVKAIVVACNTITVSALDLLRETYPDIPIIGTVPVVKSAALKTRNGKIGIFSTLRTAESGYQKRLIHEFANNLEVVNYGSNEIVPFIERGDVFSEEFTTVLRKELTPFITAKIDTLALGCTHYPFIRPQIQKILGPDILILDSGDAIARQVKRILTHNTTLSSASRSNHRFYVSGDPHKFTYVVRLFLRKSLVPERIVFSRLSI